MAKLADMEELLENILSEDIKGYMREALTCYMAGAYRGSVVMCFIAIYSHLVARLKELAITNSEARKIYDVIAKRIDGQEVYELYLADQIRKGNLIKELDAEFLDLIRSLRNKAAHPSGHKPTPEEARFIYREAIERFLSKEVLTSSAAAEEILEHLKEKHYIASKSIDETASIVNEDLRRLNPDALPLLISKIMDRLVNSADELEVKNARTFLLGMSKLKISNVEEKLKKQVVVKYAGNDKVRRSVLGVISCAPSIINDLDQTTNRRLSKQLEDHVDDKDQKTSKNSVVHPSYVVAAVVSVASAEIFDIYEGAVKKYINMDVYNDGLASSISSNDKARDYYFDVLKNKAGSSTFDTANRCATAIQQIDAPLSNALTGEQCLTLVGKVYCAADIGAYQAIALRDAKFDGIPRIARKALSYLESNGSQASAVFNGAAGTTKDLEEIKACIQVKGAAKSGDNGGGESA